MDSTAALLVRFLKLLPLSTPFKLILWTVDTKMPNAPATLFEMWHQ